MYAQISDVSASSHYQSAKYGQEGLAAHQVISERPAFGGWLSALNHWQHAWLEFTFSEPCLPRQLWLLNGFIEPSKAVERDDYYYHLRARDIRVSAGDQFQMITLLDQKEAQMHDLSFDCAFASVRLEVLNVYRDAPDGQIQAHDVVGFRRIQWLL